MRQDKVRVETKIKDSKKKIDENPHYLPPPPRPSLRDLSLLDLNLDVNSQVWALLKSNFFLYLLLACLDQQGQLTVSQSTSLKARKMNFHNNGEVGDKFYTDRWVTNSCSCRENLPSLLLNLQSCSYVVVML